MEEISSNSLFHFTNKKALIGILDSGFRISYCDEYLPNQYSDNGSDLHVEKPYFDGGRNKIIWKLSVPMVCFCDLPLTLNVLHKNKYGHFGIGLKKTWGVKKGINPLFYIAKNSRVAKDLTVSLKKTESLNFRSKLFNTKDGNFPLDIYDYDPTNSEIIDNWGNVYSIIQLNTKYVSESIRKYTDYPAYDAEILNYYDEREWRYLPNHPYLVKKTERLFTANNDIIKEFLSKPEINKPEYENLLFDFNDIDYIILENIIEKDEIVNLILNSKLFVNHELNEAKIAEKIKIS